MSIVKKHLKKILFAVLGIGVVSAAPLLRDPKIDINNYEIKPITFQNKEISFPCTDGQDHAGETVVIRTDDCDIVSWGGDSDNVYTYVAVSNQSNDDQNFQLQGFHSGGSEFVKFEELKLRVPYQREVDDFSDVPYECPEGWDLTKELSPIYEKYSCSSLKETKLCKTVEKTTCTVSEKTGSHTETYYVDELGSIIKNPSPDASLDLSSKKREDVKMVLKDQIQYWIPSGETKYFRAKLKFPHGKDLSGKFSVKVFGSMGAIGSIDPSWYSSSWGYRRQITLDYTKVATTTAITGFPLMFSTSTIADLKFTGSGGKVGKSDGTDILITASDGTTKLSHEIEYYSSSTGETVLWFKSSASTPLSTTSNTSYYLYYGNSGSSDQQDKNNVWDSNYKGVYHLKNGTTLSVNDSTSNALNMTAASLTATSGKVDGAADFDGTSGKMYAAATAVTTLTYSAWIKADALPGAGTENGAAIVGMYSTIDDDAPEFSATLGLRPGGKLVGYTYDGSIQSLNGATTLSTNTWYHVAYRQDTGVAMKLYLNGVEDGSQALATPYTSWSNGPYYVSSYLSKDYTGSTDFRSRLNGQVDELRISNTTRSASWILTEYNNQSSPNTFWSVSAEESAPAVGGDAPGTVYIKGDLRITGYVNIGYKTSLNCTGGTITSSGGKTIHTFTSSGTFSCNGMGMANVLVVAGGGGGGSSRGGGGGAGGYISNPSFGLLPGDYAVTVGNGGGAQTNGSDSVFSGLTAVGGGAGKSGAGNNGGSGGGGGPLSVGGSGTTGQGNAGAASGGTLSGAGGGGASAVGGTVVSNNVGGNGGDGTANSISGASVTYAGGGGGASNIGTPTTGGAGGGGAGNNGTGGNGTANTGGGGGGGATTGGSGGSGIVIISY